MQKHVTLNVGILVVTWLKTINLWTMHIKKVVFLSLQAASLSKVDAFLLSDLILCRMNHKVVHKLVQTLT